MAQVADRHQPSFALYPINNDRTGWQSVGLPIMLIVPAKRTADGIPSGDSGVFDVKFIIEEAPGRAIVAGFQNRGLLVPNVERFSIDISSAQLSEVIIDVVGQNFFDQDTNQSKTNSTVRNGDLMQYGMLRGLSGAHGQVANGPIDTIQYYKDADYYDMSPFVMETWDLPHGHYRFVWQCSYYRRIVSPDGEVICIDSEPVITRLAFDMNHPGEIHEAMRKNTPATYFDGDRIDRDNTVLFYRPFADALQDIFDETELLRGINWVDKIPAQYVPYLSYLIGFDLPYFPSSTDNIRRALLRNGRRLQQLKGSNRAIRELFEIFGFTIDLANLWYSNNGQRFIAPNEKLPDDMSDQEITTDDVCHAEPLLDRYNESGFGRVRIPLLFRPLGNITVDGYFVELGSDAEKALRLAADATVIDLEALTTDRCAIDLSGFQHNSALVIPSSYTHRSRVLVDQIEGGIAESQNGTLPVINRSGVTYDFNTNSIDIVLDHYFDFTNSNTVIYVFATYEHRKIILPQTLQDLRSNRFDINILTFKDGEVPSSDIFEFLIEFLFRFKAFHSLLRKITFVLELDEIYNVQDFCFGGIYGQSITSTLGNLQVPPAIIPTEISGDVCIDVPSNRGFKDEDLTLRDKIRRLLEIEHDTWKALDGTHQVPSEQLPILQSLSRLTVRTGDNGSCEFTQYGQDRVIANDNINFDHENDSRNKLCSLEENTKDYCYKGRVGQELSTDLIMKLQEIFRNKPCSLSGGVGQYYMTPLIELNELSGGDPGTDAADLTQIENYYRSKHDKNYVRIMAFPRAEIHYSDRHYIDNIDETINNRFFATRRPSLEIEKDNLFIPGHRFISMANQENDLAHPNYNFRPWDDIFWLCPEDVPRGVIVPDLNPMLVLGTDDNEILSYNVVQLVYYGNNIPADIPVIDDHEASSIEPNNVTHSMWSSTEPGMSWSRGENFGDRFEQAIDQISSDDISLRYPLEALNQDKFTICFTDILGPIFRSANRNCECPSGDEVLIGESLDNIIGRTLTGSGVGPTEISATPGLTGGADYIDGYPAEFGMYTVNLSDFDFPREIIEGYGYSEYDISMYGAVGGEEELDHATAIGVPLLDTGQRVVTLMFKIGSGIKLEQSDAEYRYYEPYRLDCGCTLFECDETGASSATSAASEATSIPLQSSIVRCSENLFQNQDGSWDWNNDRVEIESSMILNESYGAKSCLMDGSIPNMMSLDDSVLLHGSDGLPTEGNFQFIDDYGLIYIGMFETYNDNMDYTLQVRDPRVPGSAGPTGEVVGRKAYRDGVITTDRQILQSMDSGFMVIAEGGEQRFDRFQTTFGCGDEVFDDPFTYHLDNDIVDDLNIIVTNVAV